MIIILQIIYKLERFNKYNQKSFAFSTRNILKLKYFKTIKINFKLNKSSQHLELSQMISIPCNNSISIRFKELCCNIYSVIVKIKFFCERNCPYYHPHC